MKLNLSNPNAEVLLHSLAQFCVTAGAPHCYQNWSPETLRDYLAFHAANKTLAWMAAPIPGTPELSSIVCTGVAWQCYEWDIKRADQKREHLFRWQPTNPKGDAVFFADFVCECVPHLPPFLPQLIETFAGRFPHWADLKWFTYRRKKLIELNRRHVRALLRCQRHVPAQLGTRNSEPGTIV